MITEIDSKLTNKRAVVNKKLVGHYQDAYDCEAGCTCENISVEYDQIIGWQKDLSIRVTEYNKNLNGLIENEKEIIASCPAYIYDSDGNAFFDYSAPVEVAPEELEPPVELIEMDETVDGGNDTLPTDAQDMQDLAEDTEADLTEIERALDGGVSADVAPVDNVEPAIDETPLEDSGFDSGEELEPSTDDFAVERAEGAERL